MTTPDHLRVNQDPVPLPELPQWYWSAQSAILAA
jgi:hypothetical protein